MDLCREYRLISWKNCLGTYRFFFQGDFYDETDLPYLSPKRRLIYGLNCRQNGRLTLAAQAREAQHGEQNNPGSGSYSWGHSEELLDLRPTNHPNTDRA